MNTNGINQYKTKPVIKILYTNIRSIFQNSNELFCFIHNKDYNIIVLTEAWINDNNAQSIPQINNFQTFHKKSLTGKSGGIVIYIHHSILTKTIHLDFNITTIFDEFLIIECININLIIVSIYRHPNNDHHNFLKYFNHIMTSYALQKSDNILCIGDININLLKETHYSNTYLTMLKTLNMKIINNENTYFKSNHSSLIDHVITRNTQEDFFKIKTLNTIITDHCLIEINYQSNNFLKKTKSFTDYSTKYN